jgi:hypothetical protein
MAWSELPPYDVWSQTCDTLHAHTQVLGKLAVVLADPEHQLLHAALQLTPRGWETWPLAAPNGSGSLVVALDLCRHQALVEHSDGRREAVPLTPDRSVADVTRDVLGAVRSLGGDVEINMKPQETAWQTPLDQDTEHATYDEAQVRSYFEAATCAARVLAEFRAPYRGRKTPVNAWWGSFDLAVDLYSGASADPPSDDFIMRNTMNAAQVAAGWWPGDGRYPRPAFYAYAYPAPEGIRDADVSPGTWNDELGEHLLDWDVVRAEASPHETALGFCRSFARQALALAGWDRDLAASLDGEPPPVA